MIQHDWQKAAWMRRGHTSWKKKVALLACKAACESAIDAGRRISFCARRVGVAESFLMSCQRVSVPSLSVGGPRYFLCPRRKPKTYLLQGLVVDEASSILGDLELTFLNLLAKLPEGGRLVSVSFLAGDARDMQLSARDTAQREGGSAYIMRF